MISMLALFLAHMDTLVLKAIFNATKALLFQLTQMQGRK
jgi:hypothetical protein